MTKGQYPTISTGLGNLTPQLWRRIMIMLDEYEKKNRNESGAAFKKNSTADMFLAQVTDSSAIGGTVNRWHYTWAELQVSDNKSVAVKSGGRSGTEALNLCEVPNTVANVAPAIDLAGATFPTGFDLRAIGDCIDSVYLEVAVVMHRIVDVGGVPRYVFSLANSIDGATCS
tara:strand:- start:1691 stop:2203 length:513 start_codon:yes stop_codon:yes gene_type:complete